MIILFCLNWFILWMTCMKSSEDIINRRQWRLYIHLFPPRPPFSTNEPLPNSAARGPATAPDLFIVNHITESAQSPHCNNRLCFVSGLRSALLEALGVDWRGRYLFIMILKKLSQVPIQSVHANNWVWTFFLRSRFELYLTLPRYLYQPKSITTTTDNQSYLF